MDEAGTLLKVMGEREPEMTPSAKDRAKDRPHESREAKHEEQRFRRVFSWVVLIATTLWGIFAATWLGWYSWQPNSWVVGLVQEHFAALTGVPMSALVAMCVVILLRFSAGPIEFQGLGFEFRGAAGQVVFWIFCFLAIVSGLKLLW